MTQLKTCRACKQDKPNTLEFFSAHKQCRDGIDTRCRECDRQYRADWRAANRNTRLIKRRAQYVENNGRQREAELIKARIARDPVRQAAMNLAGGVRDRVKKLGLPSSSTLMSTEYFEEWVSRQPNCACCSTPFDLGPKNGKANDASPSVDRFDPSVGYTIANTSLICWRCNNIKRNYRAEDLRLIAAWMDRRRNQFASVAEPELKPAIDPIASHAA